MNDDASAVVGLAWITAGQAHAFKWTPGGGMQDLGAFNANRSSRANGVSEDGNVVVGWASTRPASAVRRTGSAGPNS